jgi:hypothetical protein
MSAHQFRLLILAGEVLDLARAGLVWARHGHLPLPKSPSVA